MGIISVKMKGSFNRTELFFKKIQHLYNSGVLDVIAQETVEELKKVTPKKDYNNKKLSLADAWSYEIVKDKKRIVIYFNNSIVENGVNIALIVNDGHLTKSGRWVPGQHYVEEPIDNACNKILKHIREDL